MNSFHQTIQTFLFLIQPELHSQSTNSLENDVFRMAEACDNDVSAEIAMDPDTVALNEINVFQVSIYKAF